MRSANRSFTPQADKKAVSGKLPITKKSFSSPYHSIYKPTAAYISLILCHILLVWDRHGQRTPYSPPYSPFTPPFSFPWQLRPSTHCFVHRLHQFLAPRTRLTERHDVHRVRHAPVLRAGRGRVQLFAVDAAMIESRAPCTKISGMRIDFNAVIGSLSGPGNTPTVSAATGASGPPAVASRAMPR